MATLKDLQEKRLALAAQIRAKAEEFNANGKAWKDDGERQNWEKLNADYDAVLKELEEANRKAEAEAAVDSRVKELAEHDKRSVNHGGRVPGLEDTDGRRPVGGDDGITEETRSLALAGWIRGGRCSEKQAAAMQRIGLRSNCDELILNLPGVQDTKAIQREFASVHSSRAVSHCMESRALSAVDASTGAVTIGTTLIRSLEVNLLAYGGMRQVSDTITTATGDQMTWPTANDTSNTGQLLGESTSIGSSVDPAFAGVVWNAYKFSSKLILVPYELLQDSFVPLERVLGQMLGERLGRITNTYYTTGTGAAQPKGVVTASSAGPTTASGTAITADEVIALYHDVDPAYRTSGASFMCHDGILEYLRKLKDGNGQYLMGFGLTQNMPDTLLGRPVTINQDMQATVATGTKTLLFGLFDYYKIRRVGQVRMYRLQELYRGTDQDGFIALLREDGNYLTAGTSHMVHLLQA